jgi:two-component system OmpR family response regulator
MFRGALLPFFLTVEQRAFALVMINSAILNKATSNKDKGRADVPRRIAIIEDQADLAQNYKDALEREGYAVDVYGDRPSAQKAFENTLPDMAIIDIELGEEREGGHELCRLLRQKSPILPIVFLTAKDQEVDVIVGLKLGANEYLSKLLSLPIITTRVHTLFKTYDALMAVDTSTSNVLERLPLRLDLDRRIAYWRDQAVRLTYSSFDIVEALARNPGHVKNAQQLMDAAGKTVEPESISSYIKRIRKAFREVDPESNPVRSEYGAGYVWKGDSD